MNSGRNNLFQHFVSLRVVKDREAIFSGHSVSLRVTPSGGRSNLYRRWNSYTFPFWKRLLRPSPQAVTRLAMTPDHNDIRPP